MFGRQRHLNTPTVNFPAQTTYSPIAHDRDHAAAIYPFLWPVTQPGDHHVRAVTSERIVAHLN